MKTKAVENILMPFSLQRSFAFLLILLTAHSQIIPSVWASEITTPLLDQNQPTKTAENVPVPASSGDVKNSPDSLSDPNPLSLTVPGNSVPQTLIYDDKGNVMTVREWLDPSTALNIYVSAGTAEIVKYDNKKNILSRMTFNAVSTSLSKEVSCSLDGQACSTTAPPPGTVSGQVALGSYTVTAVKNGQRVTSTFDVSGNRYASLLLTEKTSVYFDASGSAVAKVNQWLNETTLMTTDMTTHTAQIVQYNESHTAVVSHMTFNATNTKVTGGNSCPIAGDGSCEVIAATNSLQFVPGQVKIGRYTLQMIENGKLNTRSVTLFGIPKAEFPADGTTIIYNAQGIAVTASKWLDSNQTVRLIVNLLANTAQVITYGPKKEVLSRVGYNSLNLRKAGDPAPQAPFAEAGEFSRLTVAGPLAEQTFEVWGLPVLYDAQGHVIKTESFNTAGDLVTQEFDAKGRILKNADLTTNQTMVFAYDDAHKIYTITTGVTVQTLSFGKDNLARNTDDLLLRIETSDGYGGSVTQEFDNQGRVVKIIDKTNDVTKFIAYDDAHQIYTVTVGKTVETFSYGKDHILRTEDDALLKIDLINENKESVTMEFDAQNRLIKTTNHTANSVTTFTYDDAKRQFTINTETNVQTVLYGPDNVPGTDDDLVIKLDILNTKGVIVTTQEFDATGRIIKTTDHTTNVITTLTYDDAKKQFTARTGTSVQTVLYGPDNVPGTDDDLVIKLDILDAKGVIITTQEFDTLGRIIKNTDHTNNLVTTLTYDDAKKQYTVKTGTAFVQTFLYGPDNVSGTDDDLLLKLDILDAKGAITTTEEFDITGRVIKMTDRTNNQVTTVMYDDAKRQYTVKTGTAAAQTVSYGPDNTPATDDDSLNGAPFHFPVPLYAMPEGITASILEPAVISYFATVTFPMIAISSPEDTLIVENRLFDRTGFLDFVKKEKGDFKQLLDIFNQYSPVA